MCWAYYEWNGQTTSTPVLGILSAFDLSAVRTSAYELEDKKTYRCSVIIKTTKESPKQSLSIFWKRITSIGERAAPSLPTAHPKASLLSPARGKQPFGRAAVAHAAARPLLHASHRRCPPRRAAPAGRQRARVPRGKWAKAAQPRRGELAGWHRPGWPRGRNYKVCLCWMVLFSCPGPVYGTGAGFGLRWEMLNTGPVGFWGPGVERNEKRDRNTGSKTREAQGSGEGQGGWSGSGLRGRREEESIRGNKRG